MSIVLLLIVASFLIQTKKFQNWLAKDVIAPYLSEELNTNIEIGSIYLRFNLGDLINLRFRNLVVEGLYVADQHKDTLLYAGKLTAEVKTFDTGKGRFHFDELSLSNATFNLTKLNDSTSNLDFITDYFAQEKTDSTQQKPFELKADNLLLNGLVFSYKNLMVDSIYPGVDFNDLKVYDFKAEIEDFYTNGDETMAHIHQIQLKEKSGFRLNNLAADFSLTKNKITLNDFLLETPNSVLRNQLSFTYGSLADFNSFIDKVIMQGQFKSSRISAKDIAYFSPSLSNMPLTVGLNGNISGKVNNLKAQDLLLSLGHSTYLRGDYRIRGLPNLDNTFMQLNVSTLSTNQRDIEHIIQQLAPEKQVKLPEFLKEAGNIYFSGKFYGKYNDFLANGELKTSLGRVTGNTNMKFNTHDGIPSYFGTIEAYNLELGKIIGSKSLGKSTFSAEYKGKGFDFNQLTENITAQVLYFDFNGYRYSNIDLKGKLNRKQFEGDINIKDPNLQGNFNGLVNLSKKQPEFRFDALIKTAKLNRLKLYKDTLSISTTLTSNFSGNSLENIQGAIFMENTLLLKDSVEYAIDTIKLEASGANDARLITLQSDFMDATVKGQFDVRNTPSAIKSVLQKYLPSLDLGKIKDVSQLQSFDFVIRLKNTEVLTTVFTPDLSLPNGGSFYGKFNSTDQKLILAGGVDTFQYAGIAFSGFIIDGESTQDAIYINSTVNKVSLNDSLSVSGVSISNFIRNDSLNFNIKLSSENNINQLDINALVKVDSKQVAFSILPSVVILDEQEWRIQKSFQIHYINEDIIIDNFALRNNGQALTINGAISKTDSLPLTIGFTDMSIATFDQLTKQFNIDLQGSINGQATLSSILGTPKIYSNITVNGFTFNNTSIGDMLLSSTWDANAQSVNFSLGLLKNMVTALSISGEVKTGGETQPLFADVEFNNSELVLIQPFTSGLVSDLSGKLTGRLLVEGTLQNPLINNLSYLEFSNAGLRVDYLQTYYTFSDRVSLNNGKLILNGLTLHDVKGNIARVTSGSIDLTNLADPYLDINLSAQNFKALNTTARDNSVYYGTVFGSGNFEFSGPLSNMYIKIDARTEANSKVYLPLDNPEDVGKADFITFVSAKDSTKKEIVSKNVKVEGVTLDFNLDITDDAEVEIIFDRLNGDKIIGRGNAALQMSINSYGTFLIYGNYNVQSGKYIFTGNGVFNKEFIIQPGSSIRFVGDPYAAMLDVYANYTISSVKVSPLYEAAGISMEQERRVKVVNQINLTGTLANQDATFDIQFPNDRKVESDTYSYLNQADNRLTQATWLLLSNSFINNNFEQGLSKAGEATFTELISSRLTSVINKIAGSANFDIKSRIGTESQEFGGSVRLFKDRLIINGSFINENDETLNSSNRDEITQDIEIEYLITENGDIRAKLFRRSNIRDYGIIDGTQYKHGVGLTYRQDFNSFSEFFKNIFSKKKKEGADSIEFVPVADSSVFENENRPPKSTEDDSLKKALPKKTADTVNWIN